MNSELARIISSFNRAQGRAVEILESYFSCSRPNSQDDYISRCVPAIRGSSYEMKGFRIRPHGIGMEAKFDGFVVDFDFGPNGEFDGFDSWRLYQFIAKNRIKSSIHSEEEIELLIKKSFTEGSLKKYDGMGTLYHVNS